MNDYEIPAPSRYEVGDSRVRIYDCYGVPYVRQTGFTAVPVNVQPSGVFPQLNQRGTKMGKMGKGGKLGKSGGKGKGC